jgi:hypothetical protein
MTSNTRRQLRVREMRLGARAQRMFDWLEMRDLPVTVERIESVDVLRTLVAAGFIVAQIPTPTFDHQTRRVRQPPALVTDLTLAGRRWRVKLYRGPVVKGITPGAGCPR